MRRALFSLFCLLISVALLSGCGDNVEKSKKKYDEGVALLQDGKKEEAEKKIKEAAELDPNNSKALFQLGYLHSDHPDEIELAISWLRKGLKVDPDNVQGHYTIALLYGQKELTEYETRELMKTLELNNDHEGAHYNLGVIYAQKRLYEKSIVEFNEVLRLNSNEPDALYNLGVVQLKSGNIEKADGVLAKLEGIDKDKAAKLSTLIENGKKAAKENAAKDSEKAKDSSKKAEEAKKDE